MRYDIYIYVVRRQRVKSYVSHISSTYFEPRLRPSNYCSSQRGLKQVCQHCLTCTLLIFSAPQSAIRLTDSQ